MSGRVVKTRIVRLARRRLPTSAHREIDLGPLAPADPVALHLLDRRGPVDVVEVLEQALGVGGDPQHPLA